MKYLAISLCLASSLLVSCSDSDALDNETANKIEKTVFEASGVLESLDNAFIGPPIVKGMWQFKVTYLAPEGKLVKKDDIILRFDDSQLNQKLMIKKSELDKAKKSLENEVLTNDAKRQELKLALAEKKMALEKARRKWEQSKGLSGKTETEKLELDFKLKSVEYQKSKYLMEHFEKEATSKKALAEENVNRLSQEVNRLVEDIAKLKVKAPKDGMVVYKEGWDGNKPVVGENVWQGQKLMELPSVESTVVKAAIDEVDTPRVKTGQQVNIYIDAIPDKTFSGMITQVERVYHPESRDDPSVVFDAIIEFAQLDTEIMRPGMNVRLEIYTEQSKLALAK